MLSPLQTRLQACLLFYQQVSGADPEIFDWGGGPNLVHIGMLDSFEANYFSSTPSTPPLHLLWLHVIIPWPLTVYLDSTRKGYTLGTSSSCVWLQRLCCTDFVNINVQVMM